MFRVSGDDGQLFLVSSPVSFEAALESEHGWDWTLPETEFSFWDEVTFRVSDGQEWVEVEPDEVRPFAGSVTLKKCTRGPVKVSGTCFPLSLAASGVWDLNIETHLPKATMGNASPKIKHGDAGAVLKDVVLRAGLRSALLSEVVLARLVAAHVMFYGKGRVSDNGGSLAVSFEEGIQSGRV